MFGCRPMADRAMSSSRRATAPTSGTSTAMGVMRRSAPTTRTFARCSARRRRLDAHIKHARKCYNFQHCKTCVKLNAKVAAAIASGDPQQIALAKLERNHHHNETRAERLQYYMRREQAMSKPDDCTFAWLGLGAQPPLASPTHTAPSDPSPDRAQTSHSSSTNGTPPRAPVRTSLAVSVVCDLKASCLSSPLLLSSLHCTSRIASGTSGPAPWRRAVLVELCQARRTQPARPRRPGARPASTHCLPLHLQRLVGGRC